MPASDQPKDQTGQSLAEVKLFVPEDLARAFQRCLWLLVNETGRSRLEMMHEAIHDFLIKHGC